MSDRPEYLSDEDVDYIDRRCANEHFTLPWEKAVALTREVQANRKRIAELGDLAGHLANEVQSLAREVQAARKLRATCPTCGGSGYEWIGTHENDAPTGRCPDCVDGRLTVEATIKLLVDTLTETNNNLFHAAGGQYARKAWTVLASLPEEDQ